jgi:cytochrome b
MRKILVWDLPVRLFHWTFAGSLSGALAIGFLVDDDSPLFQLHMLLGLVAVFALAARLVLGVVGSRYNRFSALPLAPGEVVAYLVGSVVGGAKRYIGHNPGAALASLAMFALVPLLIASGAGWMGGLGEELHEGLAIALLVAIGAHLAGIAWHTVRHREAIALSMVTGMKDGPQAEGLKSARPVWALAMLIGGGAWVAALFANHDAAAGTVKLPLIGTVISLGENEGAEDSEESEGGAGQKTEGGKNREHGKHGEKDDD